MILTNEERARFIEWLEGESKYVMDLARQAEKLGLTGEAMASLRQVGVACAIVCGVLIGIETQTIEGAPDAPER